MSNNSSQTVDLLIQNSLDVVKARRRGLEMAQALGFIQAEATAIAVVISELARNIETYAGMGYITLNTCLSPKPYFEIVAYDNGPGISNLTRAMTPGFTTSRGLGVGLSGSKRLMDEFEIRSQVGQGTTVKARKWLR